MTLKVLDTAVFFILLKLVSDSAWAEDFNLKEDNMERDARDRTGMWFGPRLGKRTLSIETDRQDAFIRMLEAADVMKYYYDQLPYDVRDPDPGAMNKVIFTPKLGRSTDNNSKRHEIDFTPRLGRRRVGDRPLSSVDRDETGRKQSVSEYEARYTPRLGREFTPRLGRHLLYEMYPENIRVARSIGKRNLNKTAT